MPPRKIVIALIILIQTIPLFGQKELYISQYLHNQYTVNSAFAGSGEALTLFGAYRKQWSGINAAPTAQLFSAHTPLKNEQLAVGIDLYNQSYGVISQRGFSASYTFRFRQAKYNWMAFSANAGVANLSATWSRVSVFDPTDPVFNQKESVHSPILGLGWGWYGPRFFVGVSTPSLFYTDTYGASQTSFDVSKAEGVFTAGYISRLGHRFQLQPSALVRANTPYGLIADMGVTVIWQELLWVGFAYRNTEEATVLFALEPMQRMRLAYSIDISTGDMATFNNGTHEISLRYHFGSKISSVNPRFF
jgi:type IX secretion system PorP/SprF family membrane protein